MLVAILIISTLVGLLLPALQVARKQAQAISCKSRMRQITMAGIVYGNDFGAIPASRSYENEYSSPQSSPKPAGWYLSTLRPWTRGPVSAIAMNEGYLPMDKEVAWCPSKSRDGLQSKTHFWDKSVTDRDWGLFGSPYAVSGFRWGSTSVSPALVRGGAQFWQYPTGGAIPQFKWDMFPNAFYMTEVDGGHSISSASILDSTARHMGDLHIAFPRGDVVSMPYDTLYKLIDSENPEFVWGE